MKKTIFRNYDIRGIVDEDLTAADVQCIGYLFGKEVKDLPSNAVAIGRDVRNSSDDFAKALIEGINQSGVDVVDFGLITTPMLYYCTLKKGINNCVMVTASHNPKEFNGLKFLYNGAPFFNNDLQKLYNANNNFKSDEEHGRITSENINSFYLNELLSKFSFDNKKFDTNIIVDASNGATCSVINSLVKKLPGVYTVINDSCDGNFPSHEPDPSSIQNLMPLYRRISTEPNTLGIAFDCDGDRIALLNNKGELLRGDQILYLFADNIPHKKDKTLVLDVRCSHKIADALSAMGFNVIISQTGNPYIKQNMEKHNAFIGAELSGHMMFKDWLNIDDALYAFTGLMKLLSAKGEKVLNKIPQLYRTNDIKITCKNMDKTDAESLIKDYIDSNKKNYLDVLLVDGVKIKVDSGAVSFRSSNSEDILSVVIEGNTPTDLIPLKQKVNTLFSKVGLDVSIS